MKYISGLLMLFTAVNLVSQKPVQFRVLDQSSLEPLAYVNVGVPDRSTGTVSDADGAFKLAVHKHDQVYFSYIGYADRFISGKLLLNQDTILMQSQPLTLASIEVVETAKGDRVTIGHALDKKGHSIGFGSSELGTAIGAAVKVKNKTLVQSAHFHINHAGNDSMLYRLQIYDFKNKKIGAPLIQDNIIVREAQKKGLVSVNLNQYNLIVEDDVLIALEWIEDDGDTGNNGIMFRSKKGGKSNYYMRRSSIGEFVSVRDMISVAPRLRLGFYLKGIELRD